MRSGFKHCGFTGGIQELRICLKKKIRMPNLEMPVM